MQTQNAERNLLVQSTPPAFDVTSIAGLNELWADTRGDSRVAIAVIDGPVDHSHACFASSKLSTDSAGATTPDANADMQGHGTHVASVIFGDGGVRGIAPECSGILQTIFSDADTRLPSQAELAAAIQRALAEGAQLINISAGELSPNGEADPSLAEAIRACEERGVLIVAAAGNDACSCLHVPAALPSVLAVGAMDEHGAPLDSSNWGAAYRTQGVLAPGKHILGALPGGSLCLRSGTSFATPIVTGVVALLLCRMLQQGQHPDAFAARDAILKSALRCEQRRAATSCERFLVGTLNVSGAHALISSPRRTAMHDHSDLDDVRPNASTEVQPSAATDALPLTFPAAASPPPPAAAARAHAAVTPAEACGCKSSPKSYAYVIGTLAYDFGTEARRDAFKQLMPSVGPDGLPYVPADDPAAPPPFPPNPYDARQMVNYLAGYPLPSPPYPTEGGFPALKNQPSLFPTTPAPDPNYPGSPAHLSEASELIWTLNIETTPIYAIKPAGSFDTEIYQRLVAFLAGQIANPDDDVSYVSRVSIPGIVTGETVRLFSGQVVPVLCPQVRGMFAWTENLLVDIALARVPDNTKSGIRDSLRNFLDRIYYDLRNPGVAPSDRALNFAATNAFQAATVFSTPALEGMFLDDIIVERSAFCRLDADCWDIRLRFFDPNNDQRARQVFRFTIDVSAQYPVTVGPVRRWYAPR